MSASVSDRPHRIEQQSRVQIVLSTHQGARFLREQLESLQAQSYREWKLVIRDDGSTDGTEAIATACARLDPRIEFLRDDCERLGCCTSYGRLLEYAYATGARLVFLCDQDDVWEPEKIEIQLSLADRLCGDPHVDAFLIGSDLAVVDSQLRLIHPSFLTMAKLTPRPGLGLRQLLVENFVTGSTILVNRTLLEMALPFPAGLWMHDWWLALCASAVGRLHLIHQPLVKYRQHDQNLVGATTLGARLRSCLKSPTEAWMCLADKFRSGQLQARSLRERLLAQGLTERVVYHVLDEYCSLFDPCGKRIDRVRRGWKLGLRRHSHLRQAVLLLELLCSEPARLKPSAHTG